MAVEGLTLSVLPHILAVCRLRADEALPAWAMSSPFFSLTRTADELSIVCVESVIPNGVTCERGWRALKVAGPLDFALTGVLSALLQPLADAGISIFALSTYDTDYILVCGEHLHDTIQALNDAGFPVRPLP